MSLPCWLLPLYLLASFKIKASLLEVLVGLVVLILLLVVPVLETEPSNVFHLSVCFCSSSSSLLFFFVFAFFIFFRKIFFIFFLLVLVPLFGPLLVMFFFKNLFLALLLCSTCSFLLEVLLVFPDHLLLVNGPSLTYVIVFFFTVSFGSTSYLAD